MLSRLFIQNYALIDKLEVDFNKGLNIITGETGAGKSIIMDALGLILGNRAETDVLGDKEQKCIVEAEFSIKKYGVKNFFSEHEIDYEESCILRREISAQGKSRAFVNDTPVTLNVLKDLARLLVDIHSQHQTLDIAKAVNQFEIVDVYSESVELHSKYRTEFNSWKKLVKELEELLENEKKARLDYDYNKFLFDELEQAKLLPGENIEIEKELGILNNSEDIKLVLNQSFSLLDNEAGINALLRDLKLSLAKVKNFDANLEKLLERIEASAIELKDISGEIEEINDNIHYDPERIQLLNDRLNLLNNLLFKHKVKTTDELITIYDTLSLKVAGVENMDEVVEKLKSKIATQEKLTRDFALELHKKRESALPKLEKQVAGILSELNMPHAALKIEIKLSLQLNPNGLDEINFLFKANKGTEFKELMKVASGGEFSRLMLALKSVICDKKSLPTIIFDEIDTGVSGEVAGKMGEIMRTMSKGMQVFSITHLPQVAVKGNAHYKVAKFVKQNRTFSTIIHLDENQRIEEIAKMLSGEKLTPEAMANAKALFA